MNTTASLARYRAATVAARVGHVPGVLTRRLAQLGPTALLQRLLAKANQQSYDAAMSLELLLHELAADGELGQLQCWTKQSAHSLLQFKPDSFATAALNGHAHVVEWMLENYPPTAVTRSLVQRVAALGHRDVVNALQRYLSLTENEMPVQEEESRTQDALSTMAVSGSNAPARVILSSVFLPLIYSFHPRPAHDLRQLEQLYSGEYSVDDARGLLMRLALVHGELITVKLVYTAAELTRFAGPQKFSLASAMHDAALEGRVDALEWLHRRPGVACCRADTMAAAVRAGWSDVVRWLHAHAPESAASMSAAPLVDAARWGFLDVLRTCHELKIANAIADAWSQAVLDTAIVNDHTQIVSWCVRAFRLAGSSAALEATIADGNFDMLRVLHQENAIAEHSIDGAIVRISETREMEKLVQFAVTQRLLSRAGADQVAQSILTKLAGVEEIVAKLLVHYPHTTEPMLHQAIRLGNGQALSIILDSVSLSPQSLAQAFQLAVTEHCVVALSILTNRGVYNACENALPLLASLGQLALVQKVFPDRTRDQAIAALEQATTFEVASFLVRNEDRFYTEAVLLTSISSSLSAAFLRYLLSHKRFEDPNEIRCFANVLNEDPAPLTLDEINQVRLVNDPALSAFLQRHYSSLAPPMSDTSTAARPLIHQYLHSIGVALAPEVLDAAIARGHLEEVEWLILVHGASDKSIKAPCVRNAASKPTHFPVLQFLHAHDQSKRSHGLRLGIRLAYEDALGANDDGTVARLVRLEANDLSPLQLELVADEGHASLAAMLARGAASDAVIEAISRSAERGHLQIAVALIDARPDVHVDMTDRIRLAGFAFRDGNLAAARALLGCAPSGKRSRKQYLRPYSFSKKRRTAQQPYR
jgi:hypothetical protein